MTRRGGFRRSNGGDDSGFRLLPRGWSGRSTTEAQTVGQANKQTATQAASPAPASPAEPPAASTPPPAGNHSQTRYFWLFSGLLVGGLGVIVVGAFAGYWLFTNLYLGLALNKQPGSVYLPIEFDAMANVTNDMDIVMDGVITAQVPFKQTLNLPLKGRYSADVEIDAPVPVKFDVVYDGTIPVNTFADITARANFNFQDVKTYRELEIKAKLPMKMALPVKLTAPVDTTIDFKYKGPLVMGLDQTIQADVDTTLDTRLVVNQKVSTPVSAAIPLHISAPHQAINVYLTAPDLQIDISTLRLEVAEDPDHPKRTDSPWGPVAEVGYHPQASDR